MACSPPFSPRTASPPSDAIFCRPNKSGAGRKATPAILATRDFYRDVGFDLDFDYVAPYLPSPNHRGFTGIKYHAISGNNHAKQLYNRAAALRAADEHAAHFLHARVDQIRQLAGFMDRPPLIVAPYDAELFGHWWYEGPEFLDWVVRKACYDQDQFSLITPEIYLQRHSTQQVARPSASSWGEEGYWRAWLNEANEWIYPHLQIAQERMTALARHNPSPDPLRERAPQPGRPRTHAGPGQ
jgi:1,4-alpha-glucan branching enzyme